MRRPEIHCHRRRYPNPAPQYAAHRVPLQRQYSDLWRLRIQPRFTRCEQQRPQHRRMYSTHHKWECSDQCSYPLRFRTLYRHQNHDRPNPFLHP